MPCRRTSDVLRSGVTSGSAPCFRYSAVQVRADLVNSFFLVLRAHRFSKQNKTKIWQGDQVIIYVNVWHPLSPGSGLIDCVTHSSMHALDAGSRALDLVQESLTCRNFLRKPQQKSRGCRARSNQNLLVSKFKF